jgi:hypothetical protein
VRPARESIDPENSFETCNLTKGPKPAQPRRRTEI